ncbi:hypothetical protein Tco_0428022 [Tanacetum coccineum]
MTSFDYRLNPLYTIKECSPCRALYTGDCGCSKGSLEDKILVRDPNKTPDSSQRPPQNCARCGHPVDGPYCRGCALLRKKFKEDLFTYCVENGIFHDLQATSDSSDDNTNVVNAPQEPFVVKQDPETSKEILQAQEDLMEAIQAFLKEYDHIPPNEKCMALLLAEERFLKIKQTMKEEQNQPGVIQELLLKLMDDLQILKGSQQEKRRDGTSLNRPLFYFDDDDDEYTVIWRRLKAITPDEPSEELEDPLIMGEEELSTIPEKDKSSVEDLVPIPNGSKGFSDDICDNDHFDAESLLSQDILITSPKIDFLSKEFTDELAPIPPGMDEDEFDEEEDDCYDDDTSSDDDSFENIDYVEASPPDSDLVSLEEVEDVILRDKLSNVYLLISKIEALNDNPTLSSFSYSDNSFSDHTEETRSGSSTTHANNSLPEYDSFLFEVEPDQGGLISIVISDNSNDPLLEPPEFESFHFDLYDDPLFPRPPPEPPDVEISLIVETDAPVINNVDELNEDDDSFTFVIRTFLPFLTYPEVSPLLSSTGSEDTIFDPGIST